MPFPTEMGYSNTQHVSNHVHANVHHASTIPQPPQFGNILHAFSHGAMQTGGVTIVHMPHPTSATQATHWPACVNSQAHSTDAYNTTLHGSLPVPIPTHFPMACANTSNPTFGIANNPPFTSYLPVPDLMHYSHGDASTSYQTPGALAASIPIPSLQPSLLMNPTTSQVQDDLVDVAIPRPGGQQHAATTPSLKRPR